MSFVAYFMVGDIYANFLDLVAERARIAGLEVRRLKPDVSGMQIDYAGKPCMHFILGCGRSDYAFEAETPDQALDYAEAAFEGFIEEAGIMFRGFYEKPPEQLRLF